jgi:hypothetical protein
VSLSCFALILYTAPRLICTVSFYYISELVYRISCSFIKNLPNQSNIRSCELFTMVLLGVGAPKILVVLLAILWDSTGRGIIYRRTHFSFFRSLVNDLVPKLLPSQSSPFVPLSYSFSSVSVLRWLAYSLVAVPVLLLVLMVSYLSLQLLV